MALGDSPSNPINVRTGARDPRYSVGIVVTPAASATDIFSISGSATKVIRIHRVCINGTQTTASQAVLQLIKRTAANTAGTSTNPSPSQHDSADAAPTATLRAYSANPSSLGAGTLIRALRAAITTATATTNNAIYLDFENPIVLRGTAQQLVVNLNAVTLTGGSISVSVEWSEGAE